ncbi:MAG: hypothetical protein KBC84_08030, partial [Proteobacteria bacterium]|nr:hypothetical protein [Pseudomonadota bacterium]
GGELIQLYPLGLGYKNAEYMRHLDSTIPETHRHMHNNLLNITVESGWLGLAAYCWWMGVVFTKGFSIWRNFKKSNDNIIKHFSVLALCLSSALVGWQVSGLVEYNFGDGEIRFIAFMYMGLILVISNFLERKYKASPI